MQSELLSWLRAFSSVHRSGATHWDWGELERSRVRRQNIYLDDLWRDVGLIAVLPDTSLGGSGGIQGCDAADLRCQARKRWYNWMYRLPLKVSRFAAHGDRWRLCAELNVGNSKRVLRNQSNDKLSWAQYPLLALHLPSLGSRNGLALFLGSCFPLRHLVSSTFQDVCRATAGARAVRAGIS